MNKEQKRLIEQHGAETIIEALEPYLTERRKQRIHEVLEKRLSSIQLAIESPSDIRNALAAVRTSEALGISCIHIITPESEAGSMRNITQGAFHWIDTLFYDSLESFLNVMKSENRLLAGAIVDGPSMLSEVSIDKAICLMIGNEQRGLSQAARSACDILYRIPMTGMSESLNMSVSAAISLYDTTQRKREQLKASGDLASSTTQALKASFYMNSVNQRLIDALI